MPDPNIPHDDLVAAFQIENQPVRGRIVRLGAAVDEILTRHAYPDAVANLLGEACALASVVGASLKFDGRLIVQAQGDGPVRYVVVDYDTEGSMRGYCRYDAERVNKGEMLKLDDIVEILAIPVLGVIPQCSSVLSASNVGMPVILDEKSKASDAYKDAVSRLLGEEVDLRFLQPEKKSFFERLFRRSA